METTKKQESGWQVYADIIPDPLPGKKLDMLKMESAIRQAMRAKPWLSRADGDSRPAKITLWRVSKTECSPPIFTLHVKKNLKLSQLHAFESFLREMISQLVLMKLPDIWYIDAKLKIYGRRISRRCNEYE